MAVTGYLVPFPDPGAFDLMSRWLEQDIPVPGPGYIIARVTLPRVIQRPAEAAPAAGSGFARKKVELFRQSGMEWSLSLIHI